MSPRGSSPGQHHRGGARSIHTIARVEATPGHDPETWIGQRIIPQPNGCWTFDGHITPTGRVHVGSYRVNLARFVWETITGKTLGTWITLDPTCGTDHCCNPEHQAQRNRQRQP